MAGGVRLSSQSSPCRAPQAVPSARLNLRGEIRRLGRMIAYKDGSRVRPVNCQGVEHTGRFRELSPAVAALMCRGYRYIGDARLPHRRRAEAAQAAR